ncbi:MAG TPA: hypothetical protein HPP76_07075 [Desulfuromonadales bacterium]|nr:hypothetical protein [Desulfuromonadales bacterium]
MAEKIKFTIPPAVAAFVRPGSSVDTRMSGCSSAADMPPFERITLLFCLSKDADPLVRSTAAQSLGLLPHDVADAYRDSTDAHPLVLEQLQRFATAAAPVARFHTPPEEYDEDDADNSTAVQEVPPDTKEEEPVDESAEEYQSKYQMAQVMGIGEKIKMALTGDKEWRSILVKDANKLVSGGVLKNPRITEGEVLKLIKAGIQNDEIMRLICANKEWIKSYQMRKALIENCRTPVQNALRYLGTMGEKDLAQFAKSKNITSVISSMAKRLLLSKKR